ncbi:MBL fold metallo-hydrolase [Spirochaetia bacterium]|nr:MBL fold metallo-hydrolase [Spirochaetia bacterium]
MRIEKYGPYTAKEQAGGWWDIEEDFVRSFLFIGAREALLVDTCNVKANLDTLVKKLSPLPVRVVQTHGDVDHLGASGRFEKVYMHPAEYVHLREETGQTINLAPLWENEVIDIGGRAFEVILMPGHTPGSIALLDRKNRILVSGDSVKADTVWAFGPGRNIKAYIESLIRLYALKDSFDIILPSHGPLFVKPDLIPELIEGAQKLRLGELAGEEAGMIGCKLYKWKRASFFY